MCFENVISVLNTIFSLKLLAFNINFRQKKNVHLVELKKFYKKIISFGVIYVVKASMVNIKVKME
jgi:hypothetical protein